MTDQSPRSAYIHVPFCRHRCGYCNFTLVAGRHDLMPRYVDAVARELGPGCDEIDTLYFGGGTPTQLPRDELARLIRHVLTRHPLANGYEWTVEANPADVDDGYLRMLAELGVTRVSLGGQSFDAAKLRILERDHAAGDIVRVIHQAQQLGMAVALDLIFAVPGESLAGWQRDLQAALDLGVEHVSTYGLTFEKGTRFWSRQQRGELPALDESLEREMYELAIDTLAAAGYEHYEVSNFARSGQRSRHNEAYWIGQGYWAYGPGAARFLPPVRETNHRSTTTYIKRVLAGESPVGEREVLNDEHRARERLVFGLRRLAGVEPDEFAQATGYTVDELAGSALKRFIEMQFLERTPDTLRLTRTGLMVSDALWPDLL